jgi:hypothetical protein
MMGADSLQTALTNALATVTGYSGKNCKRDDWSVLDAGVKKAIVVEPAPVEYETQMVAQGNYTDTYEFEVNVCAAYTDDKAANTLLATEIDAIATYIRQHPTLSHTPGVRRVWVARASNTNGLFKAEDGSGPHWLSRVLTVRIRESLTVPFTE